MGAVLGVKLVLGAIFSGNECIPVKTVRPIWETKDRRGRDRILYRHHRFLGGFLGQIILSMHPRETSRTRKKPGSNYAVTASPGPFPGNNGSPAAFPAGKLAEFVKTVRLLI